MKGVMTLGTVYATPAFLEDVKAAKVEEGGSLSEAEKQDSIPVVADWQKEEVTVAASVVREDVVVCLIHLRRSYLDGSNTRIGATELSVEVLLCFRLVLG